MDLKELEELKKKFQWKTMNGRVLKIDQMDTKHIFNSLKMQYNHLAEYWGMPTFWFNHWYSGKAQIAVTNPSRLARTIVLFIFEIESRRDLPAKYEWVYQKILDVLVNGRDEMIKEITDERRLSLRYNERVLE